MIINLYKDGIGYVSTGVSKVKTNEANMNEENRILFVTDLAAVSRGKNSSSNPEKRYKALLTEAAPNGSIVNLLNTEVNKIIGSPSRPLEFLPVVVDVENGIVNLFKICGKEFSVEDYVNHFGGTFGYTKDNLLYTNMRALLNAGISYEDIPYNTPEEVKDFKAIKAKIPMFVWAQVPNTHTAISKESQSDRMVTITEYWLPEDFLNRCKKEIITSDSSVDFKRMLLAIIKANTNYEIIKLIREENTNIGIVDLFKSLGYKKEIYSRAIYYFKYKEVVMTGWRNNPIVWDHLLIERSTVKKIWSNWTQNETRVFVKAINDIFRIEDSVNEGE